MNCRDCRNWIPEPNAKDFGICNVLYVVSTYRNGGKKGEIVHEQSCPWTLDAESLRCAGHFSCSAFKGRHSLTDEELWGGVA